MLEMSVHRSELIKKDELWAGALMRDPFGCHFFSYSLHNVFNLEMRTELNLADDLPLS